MSTNLKTSVPVLPRNVKNNEEDALEVEAFEKGKGGKLPILTLRCCAIASPPLAQICNPCPWD